MKGVLSLFNSGELSEVQRSSTWEKKTLFYHCIITLQKVESILLKTFFTSPAILGLKKVQGNMKIYFVRTLQLPPGLTQSPSRPESCL